MLLLFTEDGQLTFTEQNPSREPGADNLEGKREDCKGPSVEKKCFSPQASAEWPSSYFMLSVMEATEAPKVQESFPHSELESEPLSCQACVSLQLRNNIISSEKERQR